MGTPPDTFISRPRSEICGWCGNSTSDPQSAHHSLCCRDNSPPYCSVCKPARLDN